jgi:Flp pilus assembly protein TadD
LVARFEESGQSAAVLEAERALARGATSHAVELAQKAVAENPADADAWLTLGAAREASGDANSARLAYRSCVAQAHTVGLNHCRILAERQAGN